jgi:hypothetical protein
MAKGEGIRASGQFLRQGNPGTRYPNREFLDYLTFLGVSP